jgi:GNAT superfamily N-acetyltransferase
VHLTPADALDLDGLLAVFNAAYADYAVPLQLDRAGLEFTLAISDVDLAASRIAVDGGEAVAFAFLALRCGEGWIGGMGTVAARRRRGLGEAALVDVLTGARAGGLESVRLEVIEGNTPAIALYEKLGFERIRGLGVWLLEDAPPRITKAQDADADEAHAWIASARREPEPWQRADESLVHMRARGLRPAALTVDLDGEPAGAVLYHRVGDLPRVLQLGARSVEAATHLLAAVAAQGDGLRFVNVPDDDPAAAALARLGARTEVRQHEMRLSL